MSSSRYSEPLPERLESWKCKSRRTLLRPDLLLQTGICHLLNPTINQSNIASPTVHFLAPGHGSSGRNEGYLIFKRCRAFHVSIAKKNHLRVVFRSIQPGKIADIGIAQRSD